MRSPHHTVVPIIVTGLFAAAIGATPASSQTSDVPSVLRLNWGPSRADSVADSMLQKGLQSGPLRRIDLFLEDVDTDQFPYDETVQQRRNYFKTKYRGRHIDIVVTYTNQALDFAARNHDLFPDAAIVCVCTRLPDAQTQRAGRGMTGVLLNHMYRETMKLALEVQPSTRRVFAIARVPSLSLPALIRGEWREFEDRVSIEWINASTLEQLLGAVKALPPDSVVIYARYASDPPERSLLPAEVATLVANAASVPVYGVAPSFVGRGIVGGAVFSTGVYRRAGEMARRILDGEPARSIPMEHAQLAQIFDWRQLRRWNIDESRLPAGSAVQFREPSVWQTYRWYLGAGAALLLLQTLSIAGLLAHRAKRRKAENAVRANEAALRETNARIHELAGRLIGAQEEASTRVARDLHDDVCQQLAGVSLGMSELRRQHGDLQMPIAQRALQSLQTRTQSLIEDVRRLSHQLHPTALRHMGLPSALKAHCVEVERQHDLQVSFSGDQHLGEIPAVESLCLYRVSQEALRNAAVHADARRVGVTLRKVGDGIELLVADDGKGFDPNHARHTGGLGLISMEERVHLLGGQFRIDSQPGTGTTIRVGLPLPAADGQQREELQAVHG